MQAALPIMLGLSAVSAVVGAAGTMAAGNHNAAVSRQRAKEAQSQGVAERAEVRRSAREVMGRQISRQAGSGFAPGFGTALVELEESLINREVDLMTSKRNANARAAGHEMQAKIAKREAGFGAVGILAKGASDVFGGIYNAGQAGG